MKQKCFREKRKSAISGFTIFEALVFLFIFALISIVFLQTYVAGSHYIIDSKNRLGATALANQKMEVIRSISYASIGTTHGVPSGSLLEDETIDVNTTRYQVHTFVQYVDDAFDGTVSTGDAIPNDYKRVRITVEWGVGRSDQQVVIFGNFSPNGVESSAGGGVLSINILNLSGVSVSGADVHIVNSSSGIDVTTQTDSNGNITLPGAPAGVRKYVLTVSKSGYYGVTTYPAYPTSSYNPIDVHASVTANVLNQKTIVMDQSTGITLTTRDPFGASVPNVSYSVVGGRVLGTNASTGAPVYGFSNTGSTNASGQVSFADQSPGIYTVTLTPAGYTFYELSPVDASGNNKFNAQPGVATNVAAILLSNSLGSVKVLVQKQADNTPLSGASVKLSNVSLAYDTTVMTDQFGYAYFPTALPALVAGTYDLKVSLAGYQTDTSTVAVNGNLVNKTIGLQP